MATSRYIKVDPLEKKRPGPKLNYDVTPELLENIVKLYLEKYTYKNIQEELDVSYGLVQRTVSKYKKDMYES